MGTSKKLSYLLRHSDLPDEQGWISVEDLVSRFGYTEQGLKQIVANDAKRRYEFSEDLKRVRALYGHSNQVRIQWEAAEPPAILYHGTAKRFLDFILKDGLKEIDRNYVHLSETIEEAVQVGKRHGEPVVLAIDTKVAIQDGGCFYRVPNGVWLTKSVKVKCMAVIK
ncbi:RNA 2'-phosphotransferase [Prevotella sp. E13-27]|uniref:RNA 2'-phosphotransferase n=1 Tax=Prevotella sp. E13-27 TaxID=2938122 RepID=UPI00200A2FCD|nr:RNA 2'-phosphotransferase [Prevotella sp. E13-27]MCK8621892.1 RNA 2'-phosphotransferase [Prevotella sp. E13-27]